VVEVKPWGHVIEKSDAPPTKGEETSQNEAKFERGKSEYCELIHDGRWLSSSGTGDVVSNVLEPALEVGWFQMDGFEKIGLATTGPSLGDERCDHEGFAIMAEIFEDAVDELVWKRHLGEKGWPRGPER